MDPWSQSSVTPECMEDLIDHGLLLALTMVEEWLLPDDHDSLVPLAGYVVSFIPFHERGLMSSPHRFLRGLLDYYKVELQHLNPNGI
jgi:hypothetical protein